MNHSASRFALNRLDGLLVLLVLIWSSNFSIVKTAILEIPAVAFNALRILTACIVLLGVSRYRGESAPARSDWPRFLVLGFLGHFCYQLVFVTGLERTTVTNSSLILGCMPIAVLALNAASKHQEPIGWKQWTGIILAIIGVFFVVGQGAIANRNTLIGDGLTFVGLWAWAFYTSGSRPLLTLYSPYQVSAYATLVGAVLFTLIALPSLITLDWLSVSPITWLLTVASGVLALSVSHIIWYTGVQKLGSARTSVYSNLVPVVAMAIAAIWIGEPLEPARLVGAGVVVTGLLLTRIDRNP